ncbi:MAG TPA: 50S ribosomal protein L9 [Actinomycetota bacterium]|nr:50S ribosomal protein L9 [Actinomycetota bacterium]
MSRVKVVLTQEVDRLGAAGEVVTVAGGFARNFLIPRGMAIPATRGNLRQAETLKAAAESKAAKALAAVEEVRAKLESGPLLVKAQAGPDGKLFGSVTAAQVSEVARDTLGVEVDRHAVHLSEPIRHLGFHEVEVKLGPETTARVTVEVVES